MTFSFVLTLLMAALVQSQPPEKGPHHHQLSHGPEPTPSLMEYHVDGIPPSVFVVGQKLEEMRTLITPAFAYKSVDIDAYDAAKATIQREIASFHAAVMPETIKVKFDHSAVRSAHDIRCMDEIVACSRVGPCRNAEKRLESCLRFSLDEFQQETHALYKTTEKLALEFETRGAPGAHFDMAKFNLDTESSQARLSEIQMVNTTKWNIGFNLGILKLKIEIMVITEFLDLLRGLLHYSQNNFPASRNDVVGGGGDAGGAGGAGGGGGMTKARAGGFSNNQLNLATSDDPHLKQIGAELQKCMDAVAANETGEKSPTQQLWLQNSRFLVSKKDSRLVAVRVPKEFGARAQRVACLMLMLEEKREVGE